MKFSSESQLILGCECFPRFCSGSIEYRPCRFQQAELVHARTAMTAVAGIIFPAVSPQPLLAFASPRNHASTMHGRQEV